LDTVGEFFIHALKFTSAQAEDIKKMILNKQINTNSFEFHCRRYKTETLDTPELHKLLVDVLFSISISDNVLSAEEEIIINQAINILNVKNTFYHKYKEEVNNPFADFNNNEDKYIKILGLDGNETFPEIKIKYRKLVMQYHPDKVAHMGGDFKELANQKMQEINEAYEYFKRKYD
jgi:DnaJ like chaperone protein